MFVLNVYQDKVRTLMDGSQPSKRIKVGGLRFDDLADAKEVENALFEHSRRTSTELCIEVSTMTGRMLIPVDCIEEVHDRYVYQLDAYTSSQPAKAAAFLKNGEGPPEHIRHSRKMVKKWFIQTVGHLPSDWRNYITITSPGEGDQFEEFPDQA